ncbi:MAG: hypothetical protein KC912_05955 [Proteobacteria bacterium]|nr:hypothetical protein [Pseudomonadota bacterium]
MLGLLASLALAAPDAGGRLETHLRLGTAGCTPSTAADCRWLDFQDLLVLRGRLEDAPNDGISWRVRGAIRLRTPTGVDEVADASDNTRIQPLTFDLDEAWIRMARVQDPVVEVIIGQQRHAWGVADGISPVDVVNPYDLADPTRFDKRLGLPTASLSLRGGRVAAEAVVAPLFRPARMPGELDILADADTLFDFADLGAPNVELGELETRTDVPDARLGFAGAGLRLSAQTPDVDLALVGYRGRDSLPQVGGEALLVGFASNSDRVDVGVPVVYPVFWMAGLEAKAALPGDIAMWVEGGAFLPEETAITARRGQLDGLVGLGVIDEIPDPLPRTVIQDGQVFGRWVVGIERFFGRALINAQWVHGTPLERSRGEIKDYAALAVQVTASDTVQVLASGLTDFEGAMGTVELHALVRDQVELTMGTTVATGGSESTIGRIAPLSHAHFGAEIAF